MPKYRVYVTGTLDWDYEIEAEEGEDAAAEAEDIFQREFRDVMWSGIQTFEVEEIQDES